MKTASWVIGSGGEENDVTPWLLNKASPRLSSRSPIAFLFFQVTSELDLVFLGRLAGPMNHSMFRAVMSIPHTDIMSSGSGSISTDSLGLTMIKQIVASKREYHVRKWPISPSFIVKMQP